MTAVNEIKDKLEQLGLILDPQNGHLFYKSHHQPLELNFNLVFVRHGETYGNCGQSSSSGKINNELVRKGIKDKAKRIFQGNVDTEINQLTAFGKRQALAVAGKLKTDLLDHAWEPDVILVSPLSRARDTALPFAQQNHYEKRVVLHDGIRELSFGSWDNCRICDMSEHNPCHLFYQDQNTLVKESGTNGNGVYQTAENFSEVLLRAHEVLSTLNNNYAGKNILMFSHSMFGAACCILSGRGQKIENGEYLAFDGKRHDGSDYIMPNATPIIF